MYDKNNIFAKMLRKEILYKPVYEDEHVLFINDMYPKAKIHILGIPKIEAIDYGDFIIKCNQEVVVYFFTKIYQVVVEAGIKDGGFKILTNSGKNGGQEIPHFHVHILGGEKLNHLK